MTLRDSTFWAILETRRSRWLFSLQTNLYQRVHKNIHINYLRSRWYLERTRNSKILKWMRYASYIHTKCYCPVRFIPLKLLLEWVEVHSEQYGLEVQKSCLMDWFARWSQSVSRKSQSKSQRQQIGIRELFPLLNVSVICYLTVDSPLSLALFWSLDWMIFLGSNQNQSTSSHNSCFHKLNWNENHWMFLATATRNIINNSRRLTVFVSATQWLII